VVSQDSDHVDITFDKEYAQTPLVNISINLDDPNNSSPDVLSTQSALENSILSGDIRYIVSNSNTKGFTIKLNKVAPVDVRFSWSALAVKDAKTITSPKGLNSTPAPTPDNSSSPTNNSTPLPSPTAASSPVPSTLQPTPSPSAPINSPAPSPIASPSP
jgi:hypothetical protein